ncbi:MAG: DUF805 domain-containing protein, partial [Ilumatobacter sp.]
GATGVTGGVQLRLVCGRDPPNSAGQDSQLTGTTMEPFTNAFTTVMGRYVDFSGRTSNATFWRFIAVYAVVYIVLLVLGAAISSLFTILGFLWALGTLLPHLGAAVRRLHDTGKSGWFILCGLIPIAGFFINLYLLTRPSDGPNGFGAAAQD